MTAAEMNGHPIPEVGRVRPKKKLRPPRLPIADTDVCDITDVAEVAKLLAGEGNVVELRALEAKIRRDGSWHGTVSGYFSDFAVLAANVAGLEEYSGVYITLNPCNAALLARSANAARLIRGKQPLTGDGDIVRRNWLLIDCDDSTGPTKTVTT